jgi:ABC-2 type transport system permease protein
MWTRFQTLMLREWMQHHKGWLMVMLIPPLLFLAILPFGSVQVEEQLPNLLVAAAAMAISAIAVTGISWSMAMLQLPGLVRRDQQDRSIEFWLSLPASHSESIGAMLLMHALLVPLLALAVGTGLGFVIAAGLVLKLGGLAGLAEVSWLPLAAAGLAGALRLALGVVLMSLWLAPLMMILMVASAWLKRWGAPAVIAAVAISGLVLDKIYGNPIVWTLLNAQIQGAESSFFNHQGELDALRDSPDSLAGAVASWALHDALSALQGLASQHLIGGLLVAAGCFALLVLRRRRAA